MDTGITGKAEREAQPHSQGTPRKGRERVTQYKAERKFQARRNKITQSMAQGFLSLSGKATVSSH